MLAKPQYDWYTTGINNIRTKTSFSANKCEQNKMKEKKL